MCNSGPVSIGSTCCPGVSAIFSGCDAIFSGGGVDFCKFDPLFPSEVSDFREFGIASSGDVLGLLNCAISSLVRAFSISAGCAFFSVIARPASFLPTSVFEFLSQIFICKPSLLPKSFAAISTANRFSGSCPDHNHGVLICGAGAAVPVCFSA